jgi:signal transducing adaptor molecule
LEAEPEREVTNTKRVQFNEQVTVATLEETGSSSEAEVEIDEARIDRMLHSLHEADPTGERNDPEELKVLEGTRNYFAYYVKYSKTEFFCFFLDQCGAMGPLIDAELEKLDRRHAHLTKLSSHLVEALDMYRNLMREPPQQQHQQQQTSMNMGMPAMAYPYGGPGMQPGGPVPASAGGQIKYPFPQPQAPPQSPSMPPYAPPGAAGPPPPGNVMYASSNPMPYGSGAAVNMGPPFVNPPVTRPISKQAKHTLP